MSAPSTAAAAPAAERALAGPSAGPAPAPATASAPVSKLDRRSLRSQGLLRRALADELNGGGDLTRVTVAELTSRAGLTRRTFYTHYRDIPDFVEHIEAELLAGIRKRIACIAASDLDSLYEGINALEPAPGSVELLAYLKRNGAIMGALLGPHGDPAFAERIQGIARDAVADRMRMGILPGMLGTFFDYYLSYVVSAEMGIVRRWFERGLPESPEAMARIMTVVAFVRPGDLYGKPIDINVPEYGMKLFKVQEDQRESDDD